MTIAVRISRVDRSLPLPVYETIGAVGFDLAPRVSATIPPGAVAYVPANVIIAVPKGYALLLCGRSSLHKRGLVLVNGVGVVDQDYCGPDDEIHIGLRNTTSNPVTVERGQRLAQGVITPIVRAEWQEVSREAITTKTRGGWGSTG